MKDRKSLNLIGRLLGIKRRFFESNKNYKKRLLKTYDKPEYYSKAGK